MFFLNNDLLEILEDIEPSIRTQKEAYYCQIALVHLLAGYPNDHEKTCKENVNINTVNDIIDNYKKNSETLSKEFVTVYKNFISMVRRNNPNSIILCTY